jgi:predicted phage baseplate assembly protein
VDEIPAALTKDRVVLARCGDETVKTTVAALIGDVVPAQIVLEDEIPADCTYDSLVLSGNAVLSGHGETRAEKVLGSGDATKLNPEYILEVEGAAFVPDAAQPSGVAADIDVKVAGQIWEQVGNLKDSGPADIHYIVRMTEDGYLRIGFGDGENGRRLPTGVNNLRVRFRQGAGAAGNLNPDSLIKPVKPHALVDSVEQPLPAAGGADREDVKSLRTSAPSTVLTLERAVSLKDFALLMRANSSVAQARAFALPTGYGQRENIEVVVIPAGGAAFTSDLRDALEAYALAAALPGVLVKASAYEPVIVALRVTLRIKTSEFESEAVAAAVRSGLIAAFSLENRALGQSLYRGELFQVTEAVTGVENSDCRIEFDASTQSLTESPLVVQGADGVVRMMRPGKRQAIHLDASAPDIEITVEEYSL